MRDPSINNIVILVLVENTLSHCKVMSIRKVAVQFQMTTIVPESDVSIGNSVFRQNCLDQVQVQFRLRHHGLQVDTTLLLLLEYYVGWGLVKPREIVILSFNALHYYLFIY